jgi:hypothetical protein
MGRQNPSNYLRSRRTLDGYTPGASAGDDTPAICDRLSCDELVLILSADPAWQLPRGCAHARLRMAEARAAIRYLRRDEDVQHHVAGGHPPVNERRAA